jgi:DNA-binding IclR family transcriptional regulator
MNIGGLAVLNARVAGSQECAAGGIVGAALIHKAARVLHALAAGDREGMRLTEVAAQVGLNRSTAHRILAALCESGLVEQNPETRLYRLGTDMFFLGIRVASPFDLKSLGQHPCARLCMATGDTVFLSTRRGFTSICIERYEGEYPIKVLTLDVGSIRPLGVGAGSLAMLSALPDWEVDAVLDGSGEQLAAYPQFTPAELRRLVAQTREAGYAFNDQMIIPGMSAVGVAVRAECGELLGALSIAAICSRMEQGRREEIVGMLHAEAQQLASRFAVKSTISLRKGDKVREETVTCD